MIFSYIIFFRDYFSRAAKRPWSEQYLQPSGAIDVRLMYAIVPREVKQLT